MTSKRLIYLFIIAFVGLVSAMMGVFAGGTIVIYLLNQKPTNVEQQSVASVSPTPETPPATTLVYSNSDIQTSITKAAEEVGPTVVTVVATVPGFSTFFGQTADESVSGSGFFISKDGYVLTNNHVVEGARDVNVILSDGTKSSAQIVGTDPYADLAVLKSNGMVPAIAQLGNSDELKPGESVIAIGSPLGDFKNSVTVGVVSATGRVIDSGQGYQIEDLIQTDAAINSGNSGGPLINLLGEVIGINTLVVRGNGFSSTIAEGLGFAIPINTARVVADQLIQKGYVSRPYLGIRWQPITPDIATAYNLPVQWGVYVTQLVPGGPAENAALQQGDILIKIGDIPIDADHSYINALYNYKPGETVSIEIIRGSSKLDVKVTLGEAKGNG